MKAIIEFNLPEDQCEYELANAAGDMVSTLSDLLGEIRSRLKYGEGVTDKEAETLDNLRALISDRCGALIDKGYL